MELVSEGPSHRFQGVRNVLVCVYWGAPSPRALRDRIPWLESAITRHGKVGLFVVVTSNAAGSLPSRSFRDESRAQAERYRDALDFSASVIEGSGVHHTLVRTFLRGLTVVAGRGVEVRFFEDVSGGARWAAARAAPYDGPDAKALLDTVARLRP